MVGSGRGSRKQKAEGPGRIWGRKKPEPARELAFLLGGDRVGPRRRHSETAVSGASQMMKVGVIAKSFQGERACGLSGPSRVKGSHNGDNEAESLSIADGQL